MMKTIGIAPGFPGTACFAGAPARAWLAQTPADDAAVAQTGEAPK